MHRPNPTWRSSRDARVPAPPPRFVPLKRRLAHAQPAVTTGNDERRVPEDVGAAVQRVESVGWEGVRSAAPVSGAPNDGGNRKVQGGASSEGGAVGGGRQVIRERGQRAGKY